jgi:hypothetical protein
MDVVDYDKSICINIIPAPANLFGNETWSNVIISVVLYD